MLEDNEEKERLKKKLRVSQQDKEQIEQAFRHVIDWIRKQFGVKIPPCRGDDDATTQMTRIYRSYEDLLMTFRLNVAIRKYWGDMKKMMLEEFCPDEEVQRMEDELRSLKLRDTNIAVYTQRFHELVLLCPEAVPTKKGNYQGNNSHQQYNNQRQGNARALTNTPAEQVGYKGHKPLYNNCKRHHNGHLFKIDLMPIELGTFDVIIGMDWLVKQDTVIVYGKKVVHVPYKNKSLVVKGDRGASRLKVISCIKARKFIERGSQLFVAHVTEKYPQEKWIKDVLVIRDFPKVFPDNLSGLPPPRQVEFRIDLAPGAALIARVPYRLAPSEMKELAKQLQELSEKGFIRP
nr:putative reverse transcriptase domain-containing protein [Tanacetum cinerariifolium]